MVPVLPNLESASASELDLQSAHDETRITSSLVIKDEDDERMAEEEEETEDTTTSGVKATNTVIVCLGNLQSDVVVFSLCSVSVHELTSTSPFSIVCSMLFKGYTHK